MAKQLRGSVGTLRRRLNSDEGDFFFGLGIGLAVAFVCGVGAYILYKWYQGWNISTPAPPVRRKSVMTAQRSTPECRKSVMTALPEHLKSNEHMAPKNRKSTASAKSAKSSKKAEALLDAAKAEETKRREIEAQLADLRNRLNAALRSSKSDQSKAERAIKASGTGKLLTSADYHWKVAARSALIVQKLKAEVEKTEKTLETATTKAAKALNVALAAGGSIYKEIADEVAIDPNGETSDLGSRKAARSRCRSASAHLRGANQRRRSGNSAQGTLSRTSSKGSADLESGFPKPRSENLHKFRKEARSRPRPARGPVGVPTGEGDDAPDLARPKGLAKSMTYDLVYVVRRREISA